MSPSPPFVDLETNTLNLDQIRAEAIPLLGLVVLFGSLGLLLVYIGADFYGLIGTIFALLGQLVFAVGTGIVLIYVIARGIQLADG